MLQRKEMKAVFNSELEEIGKKVISIIQEIKLLSNVQKQQSSIHTALLHLEHFTLWGGDPMIWGYNIIVSDHWHNCQCLI